MDDTDIKLTVRLLDIAESCPAGADNFCSCFNIRHFDAPSDSDSLPRETCRTTNVSFPVSFYQILYKYFNTIVKINVVIIEIILELHSWFSE